MTEQAANRMLVRNATRGVGCPACCMVMWPGALHLDGCPNKPPAPGSGAARARATRKRARLAGTNRA